MIKWEGLQSIVLDYQSRRFKVVSAFGDGALEPSANWARQYLHLDLSTCAVDSYVPRAENTIWSVKERLRSIQCETPFKKFLRRLTIEIVKQVTVLSTLSEENQECIQ